MSTKVLKTHHLKRTKKKINLKILKKKGIK